MATGAPLPVREFTSAAEMRAHYAAVRARCFGPAPRLAPKPEPAPYVAPEPEPVGVPVEAEKIPDPFVERTLAEYGTPQITSAQQREGRATLRGSDCLRIVAQVTGLSAAAIQGPRRVSGLVKARQITMWLLIVHAKKSLPQAGYLMGGRDHTTVLHACRRVASAGLPADVLGADAVGAAQALWDASWPTNYRQGGPCA